MQNDDFWRLTSLPLLKQEITINKTKYAFGSHELGRGGFGIVYPARRTRDGLFDYFD